MTVLTSRGGGCHCGRHLYKRGSVLTVEAAVDPKGESVIVEQLANLAQARSKSKRKRFEDLNERFKMLATYGELEVPTEMRPIEDELWEIKTAEDRIPFYRRPATRSHEQSVRLAFWFEKARGKTPQGKMPRGLIRKGLWIVRGDAEHDTLN